MGDPQIAVRRSMHAFTGVRMLRSGHKAMLRYATLATLLL